jgi:4-aminobutyrate aminotransferase/(S)-3-amino-2-methylpropionate transaminase
MIGIEFVKKGREPNPEAVSFILKYCLEKGLIILEAGTYKNVVRFIPPLITTVEQMDEALTIFEEAVRKAG